MEGMPPRAPADADGALGEALIDSDERQAPSRALKARKTVAALLACVATLSLVVSYRSYPLITPSVDSSGRQDAPAARSHKQPEVERTTGAQADQTQRAQMEAWAEGKLTELVEHGFLSAAALASAKHKKKGVTGFEQLYIFLMNELCKGVVEPGKMAPGQAMGSQALDALVERLHLVPFKDQIIKHSYGNATFTYYANGNVERGGGFQVALIVMHGALRDARSFYCLGWNAVKGWQHRTEANSRRGYMLPTGAFPVIYKVESVMVIAPKYMYQADKPISTDVWWNGSKPWGDWRGGGDSDHRSSAMVSSYACLNLISLNLLNKAKFPNLHQIVMIGHSAGGQFVQRYALMSHLFPHGLTNPSLDFRYVIANPSSYTYFDDRRWAYQCSNGKCSKAVLKRLTEETKDEFICHDKGWDDWQYGTRNLHSKYGDVKGDTVPYIASFNYKDAIDRYPFRNMIYLVGQNDTCNDDKQWVDFCDKSCWKREEKCFRNMMDIRCPAMLQGWNRRLRAYHYYEYLRAFYGRPVHDLFTVMNSGHNTTSMFLSKIGLDAVFGVFS